MIIGVLGGSFCPPTIAHLELSRQCLKSGLCDKVIWVPVNDAYKKSTNIPAKHRCEMVRLTLQNEKNIEYSLHEQKHKDIIRTYESLQELQALYPNDKLLFIAGADKLRFKWIQREAFVKNFGLILTNREDVDCEAVIASSKTLSQYRDNIYVINYESSVSSTQARDELMTTAQTNLVVPEVLGYIKRNNLFK
jgi:nicotinate-nucleotide adenylyltransferase